MQRALCIGAPALLAVAALAFTFGGRLPAQQDDRGDPAMKAVYDSLRTVINEGAAMYNNRGDYHGCYRLYQGALLALKPLLKAHPDLQKSIDEGFARADATPLSWQKAFALRDAIDAVRNKFGKATGAPTDKALPDKGLQDKKPADDKKPLDDKKPVDDKKPLDVKKPADDKKPVDGSKDGAVKKDLDKKFDDRKDAGKKPVDGIKDGEKKPPVKKSEINKGAATVTGKVTIKGQPVNSGFVTFVGRDDRKFGANITGDGTFRLREGLPPGDYVVVIEKSTFQDPKAPPPVAIPARYTAVDTTPLLRTLKDGPNELELNLE